MKPFRRTLRFLENKKQISPSEARILRTLLTLPPGTVIVVPRKK